MIYTGTILVTQKGKAFENLPQKETSNLYSVHL